MDDGGDAIGTIEWRDFEKVLLCAGTVLEGEKLPGASKPAWKVWAHFGPSGARNCAG